MLTGLWCHPVFLVIPKLPITHQLTDELIVAFHKSGCFSLAGLEEPSELVCDLGFAAVIAEPLIRRLPHFACALQALV